jgi:hypothetical protein
MPCRALALRQQKIKTIASAATMVATAKKWKNFEPISFAVCRKTAA